MWKSRYANILVSSLKGNGTSVLFAFLYMALAFGSVCMK